MRTRLAEIATKLGFLSETGDLRDLNSIDIVDFAAALERELGIKLPSQLITADNFRSLDALEWMLEDL